jgi:hypothetical protein
MVFFFTNGNKRNDKQISYKVITTWTCVGKLRIDITTQIITHPHTKF